ncbi:hypothetical protein HG536_0B02720 [Torulaspora globosa]|uniref:N-glycosylation protein EOS1 n=1 Tax=Torulaspora globosa TaxID=48254 RepID=A0A7G3ZD23_9SACH|nr:uncharacterized protein HG536_0B02720 [Torulaspora globosa]QLL31409.1 hypothetical protein HG536_0B02720 [Torulaspora globosa]
MEFRSRRTAAVGDAPAATNTVHHHHHHHYLLCESGSTGSRRRLLASSNSSNSIETPVTELRSGGGNQHAKRQPSPPLSQAHASIKTLSLSKLTAKQHLLMAICRDVSLLPPLVYIFTSLQQAWKISFRAKLKLYEPQSLKDTVKNLLESCITNTTVSQPQDQTSTGSSLLLSTLTTARASEYLLCALWCVVSLYLTYSILDSLMVRWIVKYSTLAAILRMFSMSLIIITTELLLLASLSPDGDYYLHTWILLSCIMTTAYIWQSYLTSNLNYVSQGDYDTEDEEDCDLKSCEDVPSSNNSSASLASSCSLPRRKNKRKLRKSFRFTKKRTIDLYNIIVFCVVPVGLASFITMIGLLRNLVIQRLDVEQLGRMLQSTSYILD